ncbi:glycosyltransferase family 4 protein [Alicyclobacillus tolerans]|uniref:glycosyltransferase family 4 protein n=1 Tax=Alicyclobacillus tolerans TaxID=90970 RepID=UPI001F3BDEF2|nr:glycosyltransferase family 4 protein [Alicyclobacillus tolerans]MCF8564976.1 glycosyltransferase family 4 protein [Alicyclobacillus tolerans]
MNYINVLAAGNERGGAASHLLTLAKTVQQFDVQSIRMVLAGRGYLEQKLSEAGIAIRILEGNVPQVVAQLVDLQRSSDGTSLIHAHGPRMNLLSYLAVRKTRQPWTSTLHSDPRQDFLASRWKTAVLTRINLFCLNRTTGLFAVSPDFERIFPGKSVFFVPNAILPFHLSEDRLTYKANLCSQLGISIDAKLVGMAVRLDPVKDVATVLRAASQLPEDVHVVVAGDGPQRRELEASAAALGIQDRVHFLGFLEDIHSFYAGLDVHVLASRSEGTGLSILEAGQIGVPNIGSQVAGIEQVISNGKTGLTFPVGDDKALAAAIRDMLQDPKRARLMAERFQTEVLPAFSPQGMLEAYLDGYRRILVHLSGSRRRWGGRTER